MWPSKAALSQWPWPFTKGCSAAPCLSSMLLHSFSLFLSLFMRLYWWDLQAFHIPHRLLPFVHSYFFRLPLVHPSWYMPMHPSWYILIRPSWYILIRPSWYILIADTSQLENEHKVPALFDCKGGGQHSHVDKWPFELFSRGPWYMMLRSLGKNDWSFNPRQALENPPWHFPSVFWSPPIIHSWWLRPSEATACQDDLGHLPKHTADAASEVTYFGQC